MRGTMFHPLTGHPTGNDAQIFIFFCQIAMCSIKSSDLTNFLFLIIGLFCYQIDELTSTKNETDQRGKQ